MKHMVQSLGRRRLPLALASGLLCLAGGLLVACGPKAEPTQAPTAAAPTAMPATEPAATEPPTAAATATDLPAPTEAPTEAPRPTAAALPATAAVAPTAALDATPASPVAPVASATTAAAAGAWSVEFYPDNWTYQLKKDQLCAGVNWRTSGVTDLVFGAKDSSGEKVEAEGRQGNLCFGEDEAEFFLEFRKPDGQVERRTIKLERDD